MMKPLLISLFLLGIAGYLVVSENGSPTIADPPKEGWEKKAKLETPRRMSDLARQPNSIANWPPVVGKPFPQLRLFDHTGRPFQLGSLRGKPTVIEFISMSCAGCQAFAGGKEFGPFGGLASQPNLESFETYFRQYAGFDLHSGAVNFVVMAVYNDKLQSPTAKELTQWRDHFHLGQHANVNIVSSAELASGASFKMIPGFILLDKNQRVVFDSTGHHPKHNLYTDLLPGVKSLLRN